MLSARLARTAGQWLMSAGEPVTSIAGRSRQTIDAVTEAPADFDELRAAHRAALAALVRRRAPWSRSPRCGSVDGAGRLVLAINHAAVDAVSWMTIPRRPAAGAAVAVGDPICAAARGGHVDATVGPEC